MYGASLEWLAPSLCGIRAGYGHRTHGDRWTYSAVARIRGPVALIKLGNGRGSRRSNYRSQRAVLALLRAEGIRRAWWKRDPRSGAISKVRL
jgi:hypothetical protein